MSLAAYRMGSSGIMSKRTIVKIAVSKFSFCWLCNIILSCLFLWWSSVAFSVLILLVRRQEEHLVCKNWVTRCWCGYLSGARCRLFAYGPANANASKAPSSVASFKSTLVLPFWNWLSQVVLENRPLNGCSSSSSSSNLLTIDSELSLRLLQVNIACL